MSPKETLREEIKSRLKDVKRGEFKAQGAASSALLRSSPVWPCYKTVFLFLSMKSEIDTQSLLETALEDGKKVFAPRVYEKNLVFHNVTSPGGPWAKGALGIREPPPGAGKAAAPEDFPALLVVPGLAFDRSGNRLGRGGGFYDRFFGGLDAEGKQYAAVGLCMDFQLVERVPAGEMDKGMDWLLTQNELKEV